MTVKRSGGRSTCAKTGKRRYGSYFEARQAAASIRSDVGEEHGKPYECTHCRGWHLGRTGPPTR
ncbi:MAG: hypothetical protein ACRDJJ_06260 [Actinomycetota bacterium]